MFSRLTRAAIVAILPVILMACGQTQDNALFGDAKTEECPTGCVTDLKAEDAQVQIKIMNPTITMPKNTDRVDISGQCFASLFPTNKITVSVLNNNNQAYANVTYRALTEAGGVPICVDGRFNIAVSFVGLPSSGTFTIQAKLTAFDAAGAAHENSSEGISYVSVHR